MIVYGSKAKLLAKETLFEKCPHCGTPNSVEMHVFQRYAHVFWIPFFPIGKTGVSKCAHCKQVLKLKEMPPDLRLAYDNLKVQTKTPVWTWSAAAIIGVLIIYGVIQSSANDKRIAGLLQSPQKDDVMEVKTLTGKYTLYKVDAVTTDSVAILPLLYESNIASGLSKLGGQNYQRYSNTTEMFSKKELNSMLSRGQILDVVRK